MSQEKICAWCYYARMRTDICGIYCTGGFENEDGSCDHFRDSREAPMDTDKLIEALLGCTGRTDCQKCPILGQCNGTFDSAIQVTIENINAKADEIVTLHAQLAAAVEENDFRKTIPLLPLYTIGGHGYGDDDDEDFWCPVCREHLGTHRGYVTTCPRCGQTIHEDFEKSYGYDELRNTIWNGLPKNWERGPQEAGEVEHA